MSVVVVSGRCGTQSSDSVTRSPGLSAVSPATLASVCSPEIRATVKPQKETVKPQSRLIFTYTSWDGLWCRCLSPNRAHTSSVRGADHQVLLWMGCTFPPRGQGSLSALFSSRSEPWPFLHLRPPMALCSDASPPPNPQPCKSLPGREASLEV